MEKDWRRNNRLDGEITGRKVEGIQHRGLEMDEGKAGWKCTVKKKREVEGFSMDG